VWPDMRVMVPPAGNDEASRPRVALDAVTLLGRTVLAFGVLAWVVGWWLGWEEYLLVAAGCLIATTLAVLFTLGRAEMDVRLDLHPPRLTIGETAAGRLVVTNGSARTILPFRVEVPVGEGVARIDVPPLAGSADFEQTFVVPTERRSIITVGPVRSVRGDPLGLARRVVTLTGATQLFVHPCTTPVGGVTAGWIRDLEGRVTNDLSNSDVAFHALREYVPGDDRRHVHWRTTARLGGRMMVRQFVDTRRAHLGLVLSADPGEYADAEDFELAVSAVASLGRSALEDRHPVTCVVGGRIVPSESRQQFLDGLAGVDLAPTAHSLEHAAFASRAVLRRASVVFVASGGVPTVGQLDRAADRFPASVRVLALRCALGGPRSVRPTAKTTVLDVGALDHLPPLVHALSRR
jgi:uncharacterized protein (DUF58 family)